MKKDCDTCRHIDVDYDNMPCSLCEDFDKWESKTNADHIRAMTDEELLGCLLELQDIAIKRFANFELPNYQWMADWLKQPYKEDG